MEQIQQHQDMVQWRAFVTMVKNNWISQNVGNFLANETAQGGSSPCIYRID
jgi:hypothetical protein